MDKGFESSPLAGEAADPIGIEIYDLAAEIYPIFRSITGPGVRDTLDMLARHIPLARQRAATGEQAFDWIVPQEWTARGGFIKAPDGTTVVDFADNNLHLVGYSVPVHTRLPLRELKKHLYSLPKQPDLVPYRTSYYNPTWGFCISHRQLEALADGEYEVHIDSDLKNGWLDYGEHLHEGTSGREFLFSAHICHPSLANDNCSGLAVLAILARDLAPRTTRYSYRFLFAPGTIGALTWLSRNEEKVQRVDHGLVVSCVGDAGGPTYKRSRAGNAFIDRAVAHILARYGPQAAAKDFSPYGYDERQFCSPGFDMPVGLLQNSGFGTFPEYHTSADNLDFIQPRYLARTYRLLMDVIDIVEEEWVPVNMFPKGEPQLGRRGLYAAMGGKSAERQTIALLWVLNLADGHHGLLAMAERSGLAFAELAAAAQLLRQHGLLAPVTEVGPLRPTRSSAS